MTAPRNFWIFEPSEPIPEIDGTFRPLRAGMLARTLRDRGHSVTFWTSDFDHLRKKHRQGRTHTVPSSFGEIVFLGAPGYRSNTDPRRLLHNRKLAREFRRAVSGCLRPDLILGCIPVLELAEAAITFGKTNVIPTIADARDQWPDVYRDALHFLPGPVIDLLMDPEKRRAKRIFRSADAIVAVSSTYLRWALGYAGRPARETDRVFPLGYPETNAASRTPVAPDSQIKCVFVGSFGRSYDLSTVIDAARVLAERHDERFAFVLAGDGDERLALERRASGLDNVEFTSWLDQHEITELLCRSSIGLMPYRLWARQSLPNKPYEYWAHGLPVLSSIRGECADIIEANAVGISYAAEDVNAFIEALDRLANNPSQVAEYRANALRLFHARFSEARVYGDFADYLEEMADRAP